MFILKILRHLYCAAQLSRLIYCIYEYHKHYLDMLLDAFLLVNIMHFLLSAISFPSLRPQTYSDEDHNQALISSFVCLGAPLTFR